MKTIFLDCSMGAAGDMLSAALFELLPDENKVSFIEKLNSAGIPGVVFTAEKSVKCGITGTHMSVKVNGEEEDCTDEHGHHHHEGEHEHHHHHEHRCPGDIFALVDTLNVSEKVKSDVKQVYEKIALAEAKLHGTQPGEVHFHEVGSLDAVADVLAVSLLAELLSPVTFLASPVNTGSGTVRCTHGILPVPAPATAELLCGIPSYQGVVRSELCTPTGAALLGHFVSSFGDMPVMRACRTGYGMGKKDFPQANCVRAILGETESGTNVVSEFMCNIDDMTAEEIALAEEILYESGAIEVYTIAVGMKKSRPGTLLCVMCPPDKKDVIIEKIFRHTTTLGVREKVCNRYTLSRQMTEVETPYGRVRKKTSSGYGITKYKYEYDDCAEIAKRENLSLRTVREIVKENDKE